MRLVAIDFETADTPRDSACAIGMAVIDDGRITLLRHHLIRPPRSSFRFTGLHGIGWADVAREPEFGEVWDGLRPLIAGADYLMAHSAPFDRSVLEACCSATGRIMPTVPFVCTVRLARAAWNLRPTRLPDVCRHLGIALDHHRADSDALACAQIAIAALRGGRSLEAGLLNPRAELRPDGRPPVVRLRS